MRTHRRHVLHRQTDSNAGRRCSVRHGSWELHQGHVAPCVQVDTGRRRTQCAGYLLHLQDRFRDLPLCQSSCLPSWIYHHLACLDPLLRTHCSPLSWGTQACMIISVAEVSHDIMTTPPCPTRHITVLPLTTMHV